jgi:ABC-2 type transport system ATP-binding protein
MNEAIAFRTHGVSKRFGDFCALKDVSVTVPIGRIYGFIGKNGAGKTTFMRIVCGLMKSSGGTLEIGKRIGFLPQNVRFRDRMSGEDALHLFAKLRHVGLEESLRFAAELELDLKKPTDCMSPGQQRKLQLVITTVGFPDVLVLDEPTAGLDPSGVQQVRAIIRQLHQRGGTVFLSSHVLMELENLCDIVAVIDRGELLYQGACGAAYEVETGGASEQVVAHLNDLLGGALTVSGDTLLADVDRRQVPAVLQALYENGVQVFGVKKQGIESLYNSLVREGA